MMEQRKLLPGQTMQAALKDLEDTVVPYIEEYRQAWFNVFQSIIPIFKRI